MFNNGADIHTMTAAQIYNRLPEDVSKHMRREAKVVNFGVLYGMSPHGLVQATGMTFEQAKHFIDKYFELRKPLLDYMNSLKEKARKDGYVETLFGRRRPMPDIHSSNFVVRQAAERAATKAVRICLPSSMRTGMFCKFGSLELSRPVGAIVRLKVVCSLERSSTILGKVST